MSDRYYLCIDLKTFYASVECVLRGLDPFKTKLVVADPSRGNGAITLAVSPYMKELGVKNRGRIFEIPKHLDYIIAVPQMKKYMEYSAKIYSIYLRYIAKEDIYPYSIDEMFLDITTYLKLYKTTPEKLAKALMNKIYDSLSDLAGIQKFDEVVPFIKIWVNNEKFSQEIIKRIRKIII